MTEEIQAYAPGTLAPVVLEYAERSRAESTRRAYRADWEEFAVWCEQTGQTYLPAAPGTVAAFMAHLAATGKKASTLGRKLAAIQFAHKAAGHSIWFAGLPAVDATLAGIRRTIGTAQKGKSPLRADQVRAICAGLPDTLKGLRDKALLLVGFAGAFRESELVDLMAEDLEFVAEGVIITVRKSKTDQEGQGFKKAIPYSVKYPEACPVRSLRAYLAAAVITSGPVFRSVNKAGRLGSGLSVRSIDILIKNHAERIGLDSSRFAGHSLRAGFATSAAEAGASERSIMNTTGHKSERMVRRYIREGNLFQENAAARVI